MEKPTANFGDLDTAEQALKRYQDFLAAADAYDPDGHYVVNYEVEFSPVSEEEIDSLRKRTDISVPEPLLEIYARYGAIKVDERFQLSLPKDAFYKNGWAKFVSEADYFNGFRGCISEEQAETLERKYCHIGTTRMPLQERYYLLDLETGRFDTCAIAEDEVCDEMIEDLVEGTGKQHSIDEMIIQMLYFAAYYTESRFD